MKGTILVVAGALARGGRLLLARRTDGDPLAGFWELPGGKVEPGETPEEALRREWKEELAVDVRGSEAFTFVSGAPNGQHVTLLLYLVREVAGEPAPVGVGELRWAAPEEAGRLPLLPADGPLVARVPRDGAGLFASTESARP